MAIVVVTLALVIAAWFTYAYCSQVLSVRLFTDRKSVLDAGHDLDDGGTFRKRLDINALPLRAYLHLLAWRSSADRVFTLVTLAPEKPSAHDNWIIAIKLGKLTLGYLSGEETYLFRRASKQRGWNAQGITCPAAITGRHTRNYGLWLDLPGWPEVVAHPASPAGALS